MVATFSPNISSFIVGYFPWNLSIKRRITSCIAFQGRLGSNLPQCFPKEARLLRNYYQLVVILSHPWLIYWSPNLINPTTILRFLSILGHGTRTNTPTRLAYPHNIYIYIYITKAFEFLLTSLELAISLSFF